MVTKHRFKSDKLIRDKMPELLAARGIDVDSRTLEKEEYIHFLKEKLLEEAREIRAVKTADDLLEELADVSEVLHALANTFGVSLQKIEEKRLQKKEEKGGFEKGVYNTYFEMTTDNPSISYYRARPEDYPEIPR